MSAFSVPCASSAVWHTPQNSIYKNKIVLQKRLTLNCNLQTAETAEARHGNPCNNPNTEDASASARRWPMCKVSLGYLVGLSPDRNTVFKCETLSQKIHIYIERDYYICICTYTHVSISAVSSLWSVT